MGSFHYPFHGGGVIMALRKSKENVAESVSAVPGTTNEEKPEKKEPTLTRAREEAKKQDVETPEKKPNWFRRFMQFLREVVWELKKTVWPTRRETFQYTTMVLVFVFAMMLILSAYDFGVGRIFLKIFGG